MSLPIAAAGPLKVATKPILAPSCADAGAAATASRAARPTVDVLMSFLPRVFVVTAAASVPELLAREVGTLAQRLEFFPNHGVVDFRPVQRLRGEAAIRGGDHILAAHQLGEAQDALGDQLRV